MTDAPEKKAPPRDRATQDPFDIIAADFKAGAGIGSALPPPTGAEIAFAGRSNVGKSSLLNAILQRRNLVRTSATPGSTRQINLFEAHARDGAVFQLVDLPGYGFAKRSKHEQADWAEIIEGYLKTRSTLAAVVLIVDVRRGVEEDDIELIRFIESAEAPSRRPVRVLIVATKIDKITRSGRRAAVEAIAKKTGRKVIGFSADSGEGRRDLWAAIRRTTIGASAA